MMNIKLVPCRNHDTCQSYTVDPSPYCCAVCMETDGREHGLACARGNQALRDRLARDQAAKS